MTLLSGMTCSSSFSTSFLLLRFFLFLSSGTAVSLYLTVNLTDVQCRLSQTLCRDQDQNEEGCDHYLSPLTASLVGIQIEAFSDPCDVSRKKDEVSGNCRCRGSASRTAASRADLRQGEFSNFVNFRRPFATRMTDRIADVQHFTSRPPFWNQNVKKRNSKSCNLQFDYSKFCRNHEGLKFISIILIPQAFFWRSHSPLILAFCCCNPFEPGFLPSQAGGVPPLRQIA